MSIEAVDPRIEQPGICGITRLVGHTEWICIAAAHDTGRRNAASTATCPRRSGIT